MRNGERVFSTDHTELYELLNRDLDTSLAIGSFTDADIWFHSCVWLMKQQNLILSPAIEVGCGNGIITCFLAALKPEVQFVGVDRSENSIRIANQIKERLGLSNVRFELLEADCVNDKYETVFSFRTVHENIGVKYTSFKFEPFSRQVQLYGQLYHEYTKTISRILSENGRLISIERGEFDSDSLGLLEDYSYCGLHFYEKTAEVLECEESNLERKSKLIAFVMENTEDKEDILFDKWKSLAFNESVMTRAEADYVLEKQGGKPVFGYMSYNTEGTPSGKFGIYEVKDDPSSFFLYQANPEVLMFNQYPLERMDEAMELLENSRQKDIYNGFSVKPL